MFQGLEVFKTAISMARHAGLKQAITAQNVANADTPGYRARSIEDFSQFAPKSQSPNDMKTSRSRHNLGIPTFPRVSMNDGNALNPNENGVALQDEILSSVEAKRQHDRAISVYRASLDLVRGTLSKQ